jgi:hypothetical protein
VFLERLIKRIQSIKIGDPLDATTQLGPLVNRTQFEKVAAFVDEARKERNQVLTGGHRVGATGFFYAPTGIYFWQLFLLVVIANVSDTDTVACEEIFIGRFKTVPSILLVHSWSGLKRNKKRLNVRMRARMGLLLVFGRRQSDALSVA